MKINRNKLAELYDWFLEDNDTEGHLPPLNKNVIDTICFLIENHEVIEENVHGTTWYTTLSHDIVIKKID
jgi:hypothetical protein